MSATTKPAASDPGPVGAEPLSPTTGEAVSVVARRNRMGLYLLIVSDLFGTISLLVAYSYLWSLNVSGGWAPPNNAWAAHWPFWAILVGIVLAALVMWWGVAGITAGHPGRLVLAGSVASLLLLVLLVAQIVQIVQFPFGPSDGAYASGTYWLALANVLHLSIVSFLALGIANRTRVGRIAPNDHSHARIVAMWLTWVCVAAFLGAVVTTFMEVSPTTNPVTFQEFRQQ